MTRSWRRTRWTAGAVGAAFGITVMTGPGATSASGAPAQEEPTELAPGTGNAIAYGTRVNPTAAELSLAISSAISLAGHQNNVSSAESRAVDLGIIGSTMAAEGCDGGDPSLPAEDQPHALRTSSTEEGSAEGITEEEDTPPGTPITKYVRAESTPFAESITSAAPFGDPLVVEVAGVRTNATSGVVDGVREARAVTEVSGISFAAGQVRLGSMRWEAVHRSGGASEELLGTFTIGSASIAGQPVPTDDPAETLAQMNSALNPLGFNLVAPRNHAERGSGGQIQFVDPLAIQVVPNQARDSLTGGILSGAQPVRESLFDALLAQDCANATYITIADVAIGSITGAGSFGLEIGGVQAETKAINFSSSLGGGPTLGGPASTNGGGALGGSTGSTGSGSTAGGSTSGSGSGATPAAPAAPAGGTTGGTGSTDEVDPIADVDGERGGALAAVGGTGMLLLLASAEGDRRKMRRAQREMPAEV